MSNRNVRLEALLVNAQLPRSAEHSSLTLHSKREGTAMTKFRLSLALAGILIAAGSTAPASAQTKPIKKTKPSRSATARSTRCSPRL